MLCDLSCSQMMMMMINVFVAVVAEPGIFRGQRMVE